MATTYFWPLPVMRSNAVPAYEALVLAADLFERKPGSYNFRVTTIPRNEDEPGCILGHIGRLMGMTATHADHVVIPAFSMGITEFFGHVVQRMPPSAMTIKGHPNDNLLIAGAVAPALRALAAELKEKAQMIPDQVRKIFERPDFKVEFGLLEKQEVTTES